MEQVIQRWGELDWSSSRVCECPKANYCTLTSFAGNSDPSFVIPTCIASRNSGASGSRGPAVPSKPSGLGSSGHLSSKRGIDDLDFYIGDEALANSKTYNLNYPIKHGQIEDWDQMERYWEQCIFKYLRAEPEDHHFLLVSIVTLRHRTNLSDQVMILCRLNLLSTLPRTEKRPPKSCSNLSTFLVSTSLYKLYWPSPLVGRVNRSNIVPSPVPSLIREMVLLTLFLS